VGVRLYDAGGDATIDVVDHSLRPGQGVHLLGSTRAAGHSFTRRNDHLATELYTRVLSVVNHPAERGGRSKNGVICRETRLSIGHGQSAVFSIMVDYTPLNRAVLTGQAIKNNYLYNAYISMV